MKLELSERDKKKYHKLYVSAADISYARRCASHLKKKNFFRPPWSRGTLYFQQSAFVTSLIVSYARPFTNGRSGENFPSKLISYDLIQMKLHDELLKRRHKVYAHSDPDAWRVQPWRSGDFETTIVEQPWLIVSEDEIELFLSMTLDLLRNIGKAQTEILANY